MRLMQQINNNDFAFIHVRPGLDDKKEHPIATIAVHLIAEPDGTRYGVALASQHLKKDEKWNAAMGRFVAAGRAARSKDRLFMYFDPAESRRDLIISAVERVAYALEAGEITASRKVTRAINDTVTRLNMARALHDYDLACREDDPTLNTAAAE